MSTNVEVITQYQQVKKQLESLAVAARASIQERYTALLLEAAELQAEFKESFDSSLDLPPGVKAFAIASAEPPKPAATEAQAVGKKIGGLRRSLSAAVKKQDSARVTELSKQLADLGVDTGLNSEASEPFTPVLTADAPIEFEV